MSALLSSTSHYDWPEFDEPEITNRGRTSPYHSAIDEIDENGDIQKSTSSLFSTAVSIPTYPSPSSRSSSPSRPLQQQNEYNNQFVDSIMSDNDDSNNNNNNNQPLFPPNNNLLNINSNDSGDDFVLTSPPQSSPSYPVPSVVGKPKATVSIADNSPNTVILWKKDPRILITPLSLIITAALALKSTAMLSLEIEFVGQRGSEFNFTRGWCVLGDIWMASVMLLLTFYHLLDSLHIYSLYPYRSMGSKQYPETSRCFNANIGVYATLIAIFVCNTLWWVFTQHELQPKYVLIGLNYVRYARMVNKALFILLGCYFVLLVWMFGLVIKMRTTVVTFPAIGSIK